MAQTPDATRETIRRQARQDENRSTGVRNALRALFGRVLPAACGLCALAMAAVAYAYGGAAEVSRLEQVLIRAVALSGALAGISSLVLALRLRRIEIERNAFESELRAASLERDTALKQMLEYANRAESLSLMREIHRTSNINSKAERVRRILAVVGVISDAGDITLFSLAANGADPVPSAYYRKGQDYELFLRIERPAPQGVSYYCRQKEVSVLMQTNRCELRGDLCQGGRCCGAVELLLNLTDENRAKLADRDPAALLQDVLELAHISDQHVNAVLEQRRPVRCAVPGSHQCELVYPLVTEGVVVGAMKVRVDADKIHRRRGDSGMLASGGGLSGHELEEALVESSRHIAMAVKREEDIERFVTDGLTGLFTKAKFTSDLRDAFRRAGGPDGESVSLLMVDIDHFKPVNDTHGHLTGDVILKGVAGVLRRKIRACDVAYRYGGEEMAVILPAGDLASALTTAARVREAVEETQFHGVDGQHVPMTISVGAAQWEASLDSEQALIERADKALYHSKENGRNQVAGWPLPRKRKRKADQTSQRGNPTAPAASVRRRASGKSSAVPLSQRRTVRAKARDAEEETARQVVLQVNAAAANRAKSVKKAARKKKAGKKNAGAGRPKRRTARKPTRKKASPPSSMRKAS